MWGVPITGYSIVYKHFILRLVLATCGGKSRGTRGVTHDFEPSLTPLKGLDKTAGTTFRDHPLSDVCSCEACTALPQQGIRRRNALGRSG